MSLFLKKKNTIIVFEAGATHNGLSSAKKLIDIAVFAGADAVKFQNIEHYTDIVYDRNIKFEYEYLIKKNNKPQIRKYKENYYQIIQRRCLTEKNWLKVIRYARKKRIEIFFSCPNIKSLEFCRKNKIPSIKFPSLDINNHERIKELKGYNFIIQIDTGLATISEIKNTIKKIKNQKNNKQLIVHHCPTGYPAKLHNINLKMIGSLNKIKNIITAFSDHSPSFETSILALAAGAKLIEKTITLNKFTRSPEHIMSLEKKEAKIFVENIRRIEIIMGRSDRKISKVLNNKRNKWSRSLHIDQDVKKGQKLLNTKFSFKIPGYGIQPNEYKYLLNKKFNRNLRKHTNILRKYLS